MAEMSIGETFAMAQRQHTAGRLREAEKLYRQVIAADPKHANAINMLGLLALQAGQLEPAEKLIRRAIAINPDSAEFHNSLGQILSLTGKPQESAAELGQAIQLKPDFAEAWFHLGNTLQDAGMLKEAIAAYEKARTLAPDVPQVYNNLAAAYRREGRLNEAIASFRKAVELWPEFAEAWSNLAGTLQDAGRRDEGIAAIRKALAVRPKFPEAEASLAMMLLLRGEFEEGWKLYDARRFARRVGRKNTLDPNLGKPFWDGSPLNGRKILLCAEQGFGDTIQFVRYAPLVAERGGTVLLRCQRELRRLLEGSAGVRQIVTSDDPQPEFDVYCLLLSLPGVFHTTLQTIPAEVPYILADADLSEQWRRKIAGHRALRVGLVWAGGPRLSTDRDRSLQLSMLQPLARVGGVEFVSLQKGEPSTQASRPPLGLKLLDWSNELNDFADTAAAIANLDLVITVDTAVAHLAGAMRKPVWVFIPFAPDWRWMLNRTDSPWYPTMRLFRQMQPGDWTGPINEVTKALNVLATQQSDA